MEFFSAIKKGAKKMLEPYWGQSLAVIFLGMAVGLLFILLDVFVESYFMIDDPALMYMPPDMLFENSTGDMLTATLITFVISVIGIFVTVPFETGQTRWFMRISEGGRVYLKSIFHFFSGRRLLLKAVWLRVNVVARILGVGALIYIPLTMALYLAGISFDISSYSSAGLISFGTALLTITLMTISILIVAIFSARYYAATAILSINDQMPVNKIIALSVKATRGRLSSIVKFELSFIGWWFASLFVIPFFYFLPYHSTAKAIYVRYMLEDVGCRWVRV